jgi:hypothetical protein
MNIAPIIENIGKNKKINIYLLSGLLQVIIQRPQQRLRIVCKLVNLQQNSGNIASETV